VHRTKLARVSASFFDFFDMIDSQQDSPNYYELSLLMTVDGTVELFHCLEFVESTSFESPAAAAAGCLASGCGRGVRGWSVAGPWPAVAAAAGGGGLASSAAHVSSGSSLDQ